MSYHFLCKRGIRPARTEQFLVVVAVLVFFYSFYLLVMHIEFLSTCIFTPPQYHDLSLRTVYLSDEILDESVWFDRDGSYGFVNEIKILPGA